jgi:CelD/BcsL family acetyltransferase involved in cellulose biosynthesis
MAQATQELFDLRIPPDAISADRSAASAPAAAGFRLSLHEDLSAIEREWRAFEQHADCTPFQCFDWLSVWQRHIGSRNGTTPVVVAARDAERELLFLLPLAIERGFGRRLTWLGSDLSDYNAPLLAPHFSERCDPAHFGVIWRDITTRLQSHPQLRYDLVHFEKMPEKVGGQDNPMLGIPLLAHPSGAYLLQLSNDWETFYAGKRSSATRRRDRTKRKRLAELGEVRFVDVESADEIASSLDVLMQQKSRQFAAMGVGDIFARPGYPEFYREVATTARQLVHVSRLDVGSAYAAVNLGLTFHGCYYHVLASYVDGELSRFGPGAVHLHELMRYAIENGCRTFDFTVGDEGYKRDWCDTKLDLFDHIGIATARGAMVAVLLRAGLSLKRRIKQAPALWQAFSKARALIGSLRRS